MLTGGPLIVLGLGENAQPPQLLVQILLKLRDSGPDSGKVMVVQLLTLGSGRTEEGPTGKPQILPLGVQVLRQQKIFLLRAYAGDDPLRLGVAEKPQNADGLPRDLL